jgi:hypothetical protein
MDSNSNYWRYVAALLIPGCIMTLLFQRKETFITYNLNGSRKLESQDLQFTVVRKGYDPTSFFGETTTLSDILKYRILKGFVGVIEPHAKNNIYLFDTTNDDSTYTFTVCPYDATSEVTSSDCSTYDSTEHFKISCSPFDEFSVTVNEYSSDGTMTRSSTGIAMCMYVRRDIMGLSDGDLESTLDSMYTLWNVSEDDGQKLYGENYHSIEWFTQAHMFNAAQRDSV